MNISKFKLALKWVFGGAESALDYAIDASNNYVGLLSTATQDKIKGYLASAKKVYDVLAWAERFCPAKWLTIYQSVETAYGNVVTSCEDLQLTKEELTGICNAFKVVYANWRTDDTVPVEAAA